MARIGFSIAALASLGFLVWLIATEIESPGLSIAAALVGMPLLVTLYGFLKINATGIAKDGKDAGWVAILIAVLGVVYIATFFASRSNMAFLWFLLHVPMAIGILTSPTSEK